MGVADWDLHLLVILNSIQVLRYSGIVSPEPPDSAGKSLNLGRPSFICSTAS